MDSDVTTTEDLQVTAVANWYGAARMVADRIGALLKGCKHVTVPFCGGMTELPYIEAKIVASDLHRHVINLANVIKHDGERLHAFLRCELFHPDVLAAAQERCRAREYRNSQTADLFGAGGRDDLRCAPDLAWAIDNAICSWMARGGSAGTKNEFTGALPVRFSPDGGGSAQRFFNWADSIPGWQRIFRRCEFIVADAFDVLEAAADSPKCGLYCDAPWVEKGNTYKHAFATEQHRRLAKALERFTETKVVVRYGDDPLIRELYPAERWDRTVYDSRSQHNKGVKEVLMVNKHSKGAQ